MLRILIVDDHLLIRCGLKQILQAEFGMEAFVDEAASAEQALEKVALSDWDVVIMDINLPGRSGLVILDDLKVMRPKLPVLILSAYSEEEFAVRVLKAGAAGFIAKESTHLELVKAVKTVLAGGKHVTNNTAQMLATFLNAPAEKLPHEELSDREHQVLSMLGHGKTSTEIAKLLSLSVKTVSTYRARILKKMDLKTNGQLIRYAIEKGLVKF
ncbi:MAG: response regulator transcription factor [Verrucomicrobia bacterium]|nr:response regulator transcription factor [Verrucomicrobiota bacterium]